MKKINNLSRSLISLGFSNLTTTTKKRYIYNLFKIKIKKRQSEKKEDFSNKILTTKSNKRVRVNQRCT